MINSIILQGRLTRDVETRMTQSGDMVCTFTLANDMGYGNKKKASFFNCVAWRQTADAMDKYTKKGSMVIASGRLVERKFEAKDGTRRTVTEVVCDHVEFLDRAPNAPKVTTDGYGDVEDSSELPF